MSLVSVFKDTIEALSGSRDSLRYLLTDFDQMKPLDKSVNDNTKNDILKDSQREHSRGSCQTISTIEVLKHRHHAVII
jgi:hypothetical protein